MIDFATTPGTKTPAFKVVRDAVEANGWTFVFFCPSYTIWASPDGTRQIMVWYFQSSGNLEGARLMTAPDANQEQTLIAEVKRSGLPTVLGWLAEFGG